ncbi:MAG: CRISPR-associated endonuclease Cas1 [Proteobacteria bacterium]|nr:CRISPR-associated endonuclease Cas1 [Pseudomonadota bacterium]
MGTLYIDRKDLHIKLDGNSLAFYINGQKEGNAPLYPIKRIIVVGNVTIDSNVFHKLADENISLIFLTAKNLRFAGMLHGSLHNNALLRLRQYENYKGNFIIDFSKNLVKEKIFSQIDFINFCKDQRQDLRYDATKTEDSLNEIIRKIDNENLTLESLRGYEGGASNLYFSFYTKLFAPSLNFTNRNRRPPKDPVNAMLSLTYTLLHFECVREIEMIGLDPSIGFYHSFEYGRESLACDFVEKYRAEADKFVWELFKTRQIIANDFIIETDTSGCYLKKNGRAKFYPLSEEWRKTLRPRIREDITNFARRLTDEKDTISS